MTASGSPLTLKNVNCLILAVTPLDVRLLSKLKADRLDLDYMKNTAEGRRYLKSFRGGLFFKAFSAIHEILDLLGECSYCRIVKDGRVLLPDGLIPPSISNQEFSGLYFDSNT